MRRLGCIYTLLALSACGHERSVVYYRAHPAERDRRIQDCLVRDDHSDDCNNAKGAYLLSFREGRRLARESAER